MIKVFGNDIKGAYTGGTPVKEIYSYGVKVWPEEGSLPKGYTELEHIYNDQVSNSSQTAPYIKIQLPEELTEFRIEFEYSNNFEPGFLTSQILRLDFNILYGDNYPDTASGGITGYYNSMGPSGLPEYTLTASYVVNSKGTGDSITQTQSQGALRKRSAVITQDSIDEDGASVNRPSTITFGQTTYNITYWGLKRITLSKLDSCPHLYRMKVYGPGNILLYDLLPAWKISNSRAGMFDLVNQVFYDGHYETNSKNFKYRNISINN